MNPPKDAAQSKIVSVRYEIHRLRETGRSGQPMQSIVEVFRGLDRARLAALGYALDGPTATGDRLTGVIQIVRVVQGQSREARNLIDVIDERVATRLLNEVRLPHADRMTVSVAELQRGVDDLTPA